MAKTRRRINPIFLETTQLEDASFMAPGLINNVLLLLVDLWNSMRESE